MTATHASDDDERRTNLSPDEEARIHEVVMALEVCSKCECVAACAGVFIPNQGLRVLCNRCKAQLGTI